MKTFEQLFKEKLNADIKLATNEKMKVIITNDVNLYFATNSELRGNELVAYIVSGNGIRNVSESGSYITQGMAIYFYTPLNYLQETLAVLNRYAIGESAANNVQVIGEGDNKYEFYINYNTPTTDGLVRNISFVQYVTVVLLGNVIYSNDELNIDNEELTIKIDDKVLKNIITHAFSFSSNVESISVEGQSFNSGVLNGIANILTVRVVYDHTDSLHKKLYNIAIKGNHGSATQTVITIANGVTNTFKALINVSLERNINSFSFLNITINRLGD